MATVTVVPLTAVETVKLPAERTEPYVSPVDRERKLMTPEIVALVLEKKRQM